MTIGLATHVFKTQGMLMTYVIPYSSIVNGDWSPCSKPDMDGYKWSDRWCATLRDILLFSSH